MSVKLEEDWKNWALYEAVTEAYLKSKGLAAHLDTRLAQGLRGAWPTVGDMTQEQQATFIQYTTNEAIGTIILFESLHPHLVFEIAEEETLLDKWEKLKELHSRHEKFQLMMLEVHIREKMAERLLAQQTRLDDHWDGAHEETPSFPATRAELVNVKIDVEGQSSINDLFKSTKYQRGPMSSSILTHLTLFKVLREGLASRGGNISDIEFLEHLGESFKHNCPNYRAYVIAVVGRMKKIEASGKGVGSVMHGHEIDEVFEILVELDTQARAEAQVASSRKPVRETL